MTVQPLTAEQLEQAKTEVDRALAVHEHDILSLIADKFGRSPRPVWTRGELVRMFQGLAAGTTVDG